MYPTISAQSTRERSTRGGDEAQNRKTESMQDQLRVQGVVLAAKGPPMACGGWVEVPAAGCRAASNRHARCFILKIVENCRVTQEVNNKSAVPSYTCGVPHRPAENGLSDAGSADQSPYQSALIIASRLHSMCCTGTDPTFLLSTNVRIIRGKPGIWLTRRLPGTATEQTRPDTPVRAEKKYTRSGNICPRDCTS